MTTPTHAELTAQHDQRHRAAAVAAGRPTPRSGFPSLLNLGPRTHLVWTDAKGHLMTAPLSTGPVDPAPLRLADVESWLDFPPPAPDTPQSNDEAIVFADHRTRGAVNRRAIRRIEPHERGTEERHRAVALARRLEFAASLPRSVFLPVLTDALNDRLWLPEELDPDDIGAWAEAFGLGDLHTADPRAVAAALAMMAARCSAGVAAPLESWDRNLRFAEKGGLAWARSRSPRAANRAFQSSARFTDLYETRLAADPMLRERNALAQRLFQTHADVALLDDHGFDLIVEGAFKVREGARVMLTAGDDPTHLYATFLEMTWDPDAEQMLARFQYARGRQSNHAAVAGLVNRGEPIYVLPTPYLGPLGSTTDSWWTSTKRERPRVRRTMPADIAAAGARPA